ncbi:hypothetical protein HJC23_006816 [Cyclotella cryptica]|uniref:TraB family protein n=1 Tax=Cyclotella cryptica TaxID=29204 RepID=A0ABD3NUE6_9STRA|eukprot:CCRYP_019513-RA/>CCRYP_019513-RA protein AED:0.03 eAED:0.03 QI:180/1/1/1/1/1/2/132/451
MDAIHQLSHRHSKSALILYLIITAAIGSHAFTLFPSSSSLATFHRPSSTLSEKSPLHNSHDESINRREFFHSTLKIAGIASATSILRPSSANAATTTSPSALLPPPSAVVSNTLCDPSVSTWIKTYNDAGSNAMRTIHILGTAHISSASAELAGKMVRELKPNVVFVELDAKRVARAIPGGIGGGDASRAALQTTPPMNGGETPAVPVASAMSGRVTSSPVSIAPKSNPLDVQSNLVNLGSKYVGNAVRGMYGKLESEGFKAGDEFAMSVREGLAIGSTVVLGDRDVEVTLRRLTQALAKTDIRKLLSPDSEVERSMEELLPENLKSQLLAQGRGGTGGATDGAMNVSSMGMENVAIDKAEFQTFVETMKAKENVKKIMGALQSTAPEIYEAMVAERDLYMGQGLDELGNNLNGDVGSTVAVMGMAHVDGVERYLASRGWRQMNYPCPVLR